MHVSFNQQILILNKAADRCSEIRRIIVNWYCAIVSVIHCFNLKAKIVTKMNFQLSESLTAQHEKQVKSMIAYKNTDEWYIEWQRVKTDDNE